MFLKSAYLRTKGTIRLHSENPEIEGLGPSQSWVGFGRKMSNRQAKIAVAIQLRLQIVHTVYLLKKNAVCR